MSDEQIKKLWDKVACLEDKVDATNGKADDILKLLKDDQFGQPGLVSKTNAIGTRIQKAERAIDRIYWTALVIGSLAGTAAALITISI